MYSNFRNTTNAERISEFESAIQKRWWDVGGPSETKIQDEALLNRRKEIVITYIILIGLRDTKGRVIHK